MTPNQISLLLSIHVCGKVDRALAKVDSPDTAENIRYFLSEDMISYVDAARETFALKARGMVYVEYLQHIPMPREKRSWVIDQLPFPPEI